MSDAPAKAGPREWAGMAVLCVVTLLVAIDMFVLLLALPNLTADLGATGIEQLWITDIYGFMVGGFLITMGTLGDRIGRRKLLLIGAVVFGVASAVGAFSTSPEMLIAIRAILGIAGATLGPSTLSLITTLFKDPKQMGAAIGIWAATFSAGAIVGPLLGGIMLNHFWWGSVFLLGVPPMVILLATGPFLLPEAKNPNAGRIDPLSIALSLLGILPFIYGIKEIARDGWTVGPIAISLVGLVFGVLFIRRQKALESPLLDLDLFRSRTFSLGLLGLLMFSILGGATLLFMTQFFQSVAGLSSFQAGLSLIPGMVAAMISVMVSPQLGQKIRPAVLMSGGMAISIVGILMFAFTDAADGPAGLIIGFALMSFGGGPLMALGMNLILAAAPPEKMGAASALPQISNELGAALGVATLGAVGVAVYRSDLGESMPAGVSAETSAQATESVAGANVAATSLPEQIGDALSRVAHEAFAGGMHTMAILGAVVFSAIAVIIYATMRGVPPLGAAAAAPEQAAPDKEDSNAVVAANEA
ncbi:major facilitator superfamily MFS_1 [Alloactinosynnema sp. L-07]|uniref:MFS transporter n=1 Tax=Alloactinosynnema sp. L-07 TaxID=1653480 RepID=UPI00065EF899|nr:MFS transporter [Alloactinosynnema sp. L-07]CRK59447.1 major facilitator superfamily MFS_1 [Alloactinosynnema sp. L-07]